MVTKTYFDKMEKQELLQRFLVEKEMLKILISASAKDELTLNLLLDRYNDVLKMIEQLEKDIKN